MVKNKKNRQLTMIEQHKTINCPRCSTLVLKKAMRKIEHPSGAVLDICGNCGGMWLDRNEVGMLYKFSKSKKVKK